MKKSKLAFGAMMFALTGLAAGSAYAQQQQQCATCPPPGPNGECAQPAAPDPVCREPECPEGGCFPDIQPGECWSQCITPGQFKSVCNKVDAGYSCAEPHVEEDGTAIVPVEKTVREKCYTLRRPVHCEEKRIGWTYELVEPEKTDTITYITCQEQEASPQYSPTTRTMKVAYEEPVGVPGRVKQTKVKVQVKSAWDHLYRKKSTCWDCSDVCRETEGPEYKWITAYTCQDDPQHCSFD